MSDHHAIKRNSFKTPMSFFKAPVQALLSQNHCPWGEEAGGKVGVKGEEGLQWKRKGKGGNPSPLPRFT